MSNFTDFNALERDGRFHLYYTDKAEEIGKADVVILPGTKSTIADLQAIYANGVAEAVVKAFRKKKKVIGICGGYQMMGSADRGSRAGRRYANRDRRIGFTASGHGDAGYEGGLSESFPF